MPALLMSTFSAGYWVATSAAKARDEPLRRADYIGGVDDVERQGTHTRVSGGCPCKRLFPAPGDDDLVSQRVKSFCQPAANARSASRNQNRISGRSHSDYLPQFAPLGS